MSENAGREEREGRGGLTGFASLPFDVAHPARSCREVEVLEDHVLCGLFEEDAAGSHKSGAVCCDRRRDSIEGWASLWGSVLLGHVDQHGLMSARCGAYACVVPSLLVQGRRYEEVERMMSFSTWFMDSRGSRCQLARERRCQSRSPLRTLSGRGTVEKGGRDRESRLPGQCREGDQECCWGMSTSIGLCGLAETGAHPSFRSRSDSEVSSILYGLFLNGT